MVITLGSPAAKSSRVGCSPWSVLSRHHPDLLVNIRSASTALALKAWRSTNAEGRKRLKLVLKEVAQ
jgi:hypothetical protein